MYFVGSLPLLAFLVIWALAIVTVRRHRELTTGIHSETFLGAAMVWGIYVVVFTEGLSAFRMLTAPTLAACWLAVICVGVGVLATIILMQARAGEISLQPSAIMGRIGKATLAEKGSGAWYASLAIVAVILIITGITAVQSAPNNWDAMAYHLPRVQHWIQNQSVGFYATNNTRQLFDPPWAEYAILQFQLLMHSDILANGVQWFSQLGVCVVVALIARRLGAGRAAQGFAMIVAAATPMAILQSNSPQNDLVTSFWIVCAIYFALSFIREPGPYHAVTLGAALGLAALSKGTAYVFIAPIALGVGMWLAARLPVWNRGLRWRDGSLWRLRPSRAWWGGVGLLAIAVSLMFALNAPQLARNATTFQSPLGPDGALYANQTFAPAALACNAVRDISLEFGSPSRDLNHKLYLRVSSFCHAIGVSVNDRRISWGVIPFRINAFTTDEATAGNPIQFVLILLALTLVFVTRGLRIRREILLYAALLLLGYVLFVCYLRWQMWGNRLLLPWFMAAAPLVGVALERLLAWRPATPLLGLVFLLLSTPFLLFNNLRPMIGSSTVFTMPRTSQYFVSNPGIEKSFRDAAAFVNQRGCLSIGYDGGIGGWEYPLWLLLGTEPYEANIEQVLVTNQSASLEGDTAYQDFHPCAIINVIEATSSAPATLPTTVMVNGTTYRSSWSAPGVKVYLPFTPSATGH